MQIINSLVKIGGFMKYIGKSMPKIDGYEKVTGKRMA